jgi:hypothetical protein
MQFTPLSRAKGLNFKDPVAVRLKDGTHGHAILVERKETPTGLIYGFNLATFDADPVITYDVTHVARYPKVEEKVI